MEARKAEIENKLSNIQPILDAAKEAVGSIKQENLNEIKSLNTPPMAIRDVMCGVLGLLGNQDTSWKSMKAFLWKQRIQKSKS